MPTILIQLLDAVMVCLAPNGLKCTAINFPQLSNCCPNLLGHGLMEQFGIIIYFNISYKDRKFKFILACVPI